MENYILLAFFLIFNLKAQTTEPSTSSTVTNTPESTKEKVLDFSGGVIEGELNRPSMLMELGSNYKEFNDLILLRDDFNAFHEVDSQKRFRYFDEGL